MEEGSSGNICKCPHHKFVPGLIVLLGFLFLAGTLDWVGDTAVSVGWPIILIVVGFMKMMEGKCKCC